MKPSLNIITAIHDAIVTKVPICIEGLKMSVPQNSSVLNENALLNHSLSSSSNNSTITTQNGAFIPCFSSINSMPQGTMDVNNVMPCPPTPLTMENNKYAHGWLTHQTIDSEVYCKSNVNIPEQVGKWQVPMAKKTVVCPSTSVVPDDLESAMPFEAPIDTQQQNTETAGAVISSEKDIHQHLTIEEHVDLEVNCIDMNKTPRRKPKRKKHRPKVIRECKPKRTLKSTPPTSVTLKTPMHKEETPSGKRKYVRKKKVQDPFDNPSDVLEETAYISSLSGSKSARRRLNFDLEVAKVRDEPPGCALSVMHNEECLAPETCFMEINDKSSTNLSMQRAQGIEIVSNNSPNGIQFTPADGLMHKEAEHTSFPQEKTPTYQSSGEGIITINETHEGCEITSEDANKSPQQSKVESIYNEYYELTRKNDHLMIAHIEKSWKSAPDQINTNQMLNMLLGTAKRRHNFSKDAAILEEENGTETYERVSQFNDVSHEGPYLPQGYKKQRTELVQSKFDPSAVTSSVQKPSNQRRKRKAKCNWGEQLVLPSEMQFLISADHSDIRMMEPNKSSNHTVSFTSNKIQTSEPQKYIKTQDRKANVQRKPRSCIHKERVQAISLSSTQVNLSNSNDFGKKVLCTSNSPIIECQSSSNYTESFGGILNSGTLVVNDDPLNDTIEKLKCISLSGAYEGYTQQIRNVIVPYNGGGVMVPYEGLDYHAKRRRTRPKVDLDPESNRVWNLLMGKQINDADEETYITKDKWWEEERRVFHGRVDSFIARMHLVQGDRRFSKWKGSVVDSVVGVFLTQNVSDHLSSSAFMALAARFPVCVNNKETNAERKNSSVEQENCGIFLDDTNKLQKQVLCRDSYNHDSLVIVEENETVNVNESNGSNARGCEDKSKKFPSLYTNETGFEADRESPKSMSGIQVILTRSTCAAEAEDKWSMEDMSSSQESVISSQISSVNPDQTANQRIGLCSLSSVEPETSSIRSLCSDINSSTSFTELLHIADMVPPMKYDSKTSWFSDVDRRKFMLDVQGDADSRNLSMFTSNVSFGGSAFPAMPDHIEGASSSRLMGIKTVNIASHNRVSERSINDIKLTDAQSDLSVNTTTKINQQKLTLVAEPASNGPTSNYCEPVASSHKESWNRENFCHDNLQLHKAEPSIINSSNKFSFLQNECVPRPMHNLQIQVETTQDGANLQQISFNNQQNVQNLYTHINNDASSYKMILSETPKDKSQEKKTRVDKERKNSERKNSEWDSLRKALYQNVTKKERSQDTMDSVDWEAVRRADVSQVSEAIRERGMNNKLAERIKDFLDRLVRDHGDVDLEWLRDIEPDKSKDYLLSIRGLGLKSVECLRLLTLHHLAFPVDTNVGRICVRLGWVPLQPLPESLQLHLLELYPMLETIQKYLWPRLCKLDQRTLYELHYQMITFGKVFCTKSKPNCNACPMRGECKHFASAFASARLALPGPEVKDIVTSTGLLASENNYIPDFNSRPQPRIEENGETHGRSIINTCDPIIEEPETPETECVYTEETAIEDAFYEDPDDIPTIKLNFEEFTLNLKNYIQENNKEIQDGDMSKALVAITSQAASIPMPKLKNIRRLRTEHHVYKLPDSHPLLKGFDKREPDDPSPYLLAIWTPGETAQSTEPPEASCKSQETGNLCNKATCFACNSIREAQAQTVRATVLIPCRTAMRGSFPLNGTYFQVNELFADHDTSRNPIDVPRNWIWNLPRRTVYFGTSVPSIFKGLTTEEIQQCFWRGFVCVRGFDRTTRAPRPLYARLHFPASKTIKNKKEPPAKTTMEDVQQDTIRTHPLD